MTDVDEAAQFRPGLADVAGQRLQLVRVTADKLRLASDLSPVPPTPADVRWPTQPPGP
jgi:hypothetical protein